MNPQPKNKPIRSKHYLEWVRKLYCVNCYRCPGAIDVVPHHVRMGHTGGMGTKPGDNHSVPLCVDCHNELHQIGERRFWQGNAKDPHAIASKMWAIWTKKPWEG